MNHRAPWLAAGLAALAGLPALRLPYLSDDWGNIAAVVDRIPRVTPFGYFRPLYLASFRAEYLLWGLAPLLSHLVQLILLAAAAALVVLVVRRYTGDAGLAAWSGLLFALYPVHVVCAAWVAARADLASAVLCLAAVLCYDHWRERCRGFPVAALLSAVAAGLFRETAVLVPLFLVLVAAVDRSRRPGRGELVRGLVPMALLAVAQIVAQWALASDAAWGRVGFSGARTVARNAVAYATAAVVPVQAEAIETWTAWFVGTAALVVLVLLGVARAGHGRIPVSALAAILAFGVLVGPFALFSFQLRFLFLGSAASAVAIAALLRAAPGPARRLASALLVLGWLVAAVTVWQPWFGAARVSDRMLADLVEQSECPAVDEIFVANPPQRVHGAPVAGDLAAAVRLRGGRDVAVRAIVAVDLPDPSATALEGDLTTAVRPADWGIEVTLRVPSIPFSRSIRFPEKRAGVEDRWPPTATEHAPGSWTLRFPKAPARAVAVWTGEGLQTVMEPGPCDGAGTRVER